MAADGTENTDFYWSPSAAKRETEKLAEYDNLLRWLLNRQRYSGLRKGPLPLYSDLCFFVRVVKSNFAQPFYSLICYGWWPLVVDGICPFLTWIIFLWAKLTWTKLIQIKLIQITLSNKMIRTKPTRTKLTLMKNWSRPNNVNKQKKFPLFDT